MRLYSTIYEYAEAEYVIEKSRFISHASPAETPEDAKAFIKEIKEKYRDATHNVPAFVCGAGMEHQWASDDGEPSGTSGMPVLKLITGEGLTNVAVVVTRYFGGIKLGTGGLARAYTYAARLALDKAGECDVRESVLFRYSFDYSNLARLQKLSAEHGFQLSGEEYAEAVSADISCESERTEELISMVADLTGGRAVLLSRRTVNIKYRK